MPQKSRPLIALVIVCAIFSALSGIDGVQVKQEAKVCVSCTDDFKIYVSGESVGLRMRCKGVLVTGLMGFTSSDNCYVTPGKDSGLKAGDIILKVNDEDVLCVDDLKKALMDSRDGLYTLSVERNKKEFKANIAAKTDIESHMYKIGLWVKDIAAGIGTLTFYEANSCIFGALGHGISTDSGIFEISNGELYTASIVDVQKGLPGFPGELKGFFRENNDPIGCIQINCEKGVFGKLEGTKMISARSIEIGLSSEVHNGGAIILCCIDEGAPQEYEIEITANDKSKVNDTKGITIKITDERLLSKTGGIVQGMSGSPIIQGGKLVGAVTHVMINNPTAGYGIFIEGMLGSIADMQERIELKKAA